MQSNSYQDMYSDPYKKPMYPDPYGLMKNPDKPVNQANPKDQDDSLVVPQIVLV
jgi:hypothetical protein